MPIRSEPKTHEVSGLLPPPDYTFSVERLAALADYAILDTPAEPGFDDIVQLAAHICETPVSLVSFVAADRQWFKARVGFEPCETNLASSVCAHVLVEPEILVINDLSTDERTRDNPLVVGPPHIRFYAGAPLRTESGETLGSLCVIDASPRPGGLTASQVSSLLSLSRQVMVQLDLRKSVAQRDELLAEQGRAENRRNALLRLGDQLRDLNTVPEITRAASAILGQTLGLSRAAFGRIDESRAFLDVDPDWTAEGMASVAGRHRFSDYGEFAASLLNGELIAIDDVAVDWRTAPNPQPLLDLGIRALVNVPVREHGHTVAVLLVHDAKVRAWSPEVLTFLRNVADRLEVGVARIKAEATQQILNQELSHRMKNTFAMVQAIAIQTLKGVTEKEAVQAFTQRIHALSTAHDVLLRQDWAATNMADLLRSVVERINIDERFDITGPEVVLGPRATLSLSLLAHELATNAVKHGSLSAPNGRVSLGWRLQTGAQGQNLIVTWREVGGPPSRQPEKHGFGSRLIRMGLLGTGGTEIRYLPSGFEADFQAPLAQVRPPESGGE